MMTINNQASMVMSYDPGGAPFIKKSRIACIRNILLKKTYIQVLLVKSSNTCILSMIEIQVTICIHKKLHSYIVINSCNLTMQLRLSTNSH